MAKKKATGKKAAKKKALPAKGSLKEKFPGKEAQASKLPPEQQLINAAKAGHIETVRQILAAKKVNVDFQDDERKMDYDRMYSQLRGNWRNIRPAPSRRGSSGNTALMWACQGHREEIAKELLRAGANPNIRNLAGDTALHLIGEKSEALIEALVAAGANVNAQNLWGATPLMTSLEKDNRGFMDVVWRLLELGADPFLKNSEGKNFFDLAQDWSIEPIACQQMQDFVAARQAAIAAEEQKRLSGDFAEAGRSGGAAAEEQAPAQTHEARQKKLQGVAPAKIKLRKKKPQSKGRKL